MTFADGRANLAPMLHRFTRRPPRSFLDGSKALDEGRLEDAERHFRETVDAGFETSAVWFDLALAQKLQHHWADSEASNLRAIELDAKNKEAIWNLGVVATALRHWDQARWCWRQLGFEPTNESGPPEADYGITPVRLNPDGDGEVVWGWRIDVCRVRLHSVPLPESGHRWDDIVLHDVVPRGERTYGGRTYSVFDELERMEPSPHQTQEVPVTCPTERDSEALAELFYESGLGAEDWSAKVQIICATCSLGSPHTHHGPDVVLSPERRFALAGPMDRVQALLQQWVDAGPGRGAGEITTYA